MRAWRSPPPPADAPPDAPRPPPEPLPWTPGRIVAAVALVLATLTMAGLIASIGFTGTAVAVALPPLLLLLWPRAEGLKVAWAALPFFLLVGAGLCVLTVLSLQTG